MDKVEAKWKEVEKVVKDAGKGGENKTDGSVAGERPKEKVNRRFEEAMRVWHKLFEDERVFWSTRGDARQAEFGDGLDTKGFVVQHERKEGRDVSEVGKWLLESLDKECCNCEEAPEVVNVEVKKKLEEVMRMEEVAKSARGCKVGRSDVQLFLHSDASKTKPQSRLAYNPKTDLQVGHVAVVKAVPEDTPGGRGWDLVQVVCQIEDEDEDDGEATKKKKKGKKSYQASLIWI